MNRKDKLLKLVTHINCFNTEPTEKSAEYIYLDTILTEDDMIDAALALEQRVPTYIGELAPRIGKSIEETAELCFRMAKAGIVYYETDKDGVDRVNLPIFVPGTMECACFRPADTDRHPQLAYTFDKYIDEYRIDGVVELVLQTCNPFALETDINRRFITEKKGVPYLSIETDFSDNDKGRSGGSKLLGGKICPLTGCCTV